MAEKYRKYEGDCMPDEHHGFGPIVSECSKILILGTYPGPHSLQSGEYYSSPHNCFWRLVYKLLSGQPSGVYEEKCEFFVSEGLALWDVYRAAERQGAADANILNGMANNFAEFFASYPQIKGIVFNGRKAETLFERKFPHLYNHIPHVTVWSSSGACAKTFPEKLTNWQTALATLSLNIDSDCI